MLHQQLLKYFAASRDAAAPIGAHIVDEATNKSRGRGDGIKPESAARAPPPPPKRAQFVDNASPTARRRPLTPTRQHHAHAAPTACAAVKSFDRIRRDVAPAGRRRQYTGRS